MMWTSSHSFSFFIFIIVPPLLLLSGGYNVLGAKNHSPVDYMRIIERQQQPQQHKTRRRANGIRRDQNNSNNQKQDNNSNGNGRGGNSNNNGNNGNNPTNENPIPPVEPNQNNGNNNDTPEGNAQYQLQTFFDSILQLQSDYGPNVISVQDATEAYPILGQSYIDIGQACPFSYNGGGDDNSDNNNKHNNNNNNNNEGIRPCYTPIITLHDWISNSWTSKTSMQLQRQIYNAELPEVLFVGGLLSEENANAQSIIDTLGPLSIVETLKLLLECAHCESLSPWRQQPMKADKNENVNENAKWGAGERREDATNQKMMTMQDHSTEDTSTNNDNQNNGDSLSDNNDDNGSSSFPTSNNAIACREQLASKGIDDTTRKWLGRLVATRRIVAVPIANVAAFYHGMVRLERAKQGLPPQQTKNHQGTSCDGGGDYPYPFHRKSSVSSMSISAGFHSAASSSNNGPPTPNNCMNGFSSRLMNELFRSHAFQLGVAFHNDAGAGDAALSNNNNNNNMASSSSISPWRIEVPSWKENVSNNNNNNNAMMMSYDEKAMMDIAWSYSKFAAAAGNNPNGDYGGYYSVVLQSNANDGPGSNVVEDTAHHHSCNGEGGGGATLEQFAFSAGMVANGAGVNEGSLWMEQCQCHHHRGMNDDGEEDDVCAYPSEQTGVYDGSSLRAFVAKVVAPPPPPQAPSSPSIMGDLSLFTGVPKNQQQISSSSSGALLYDQSTLGTYLRMSLLATELVEPYTSIRSIANIPLRDDDRIPFSPRMPGACVTSTRVMKMPDSPALKEVEVTWTVGGALSVDETAIMYGKWDVLDKKIFDCMTQPTKQELDAFFTILRDFEVMEGETAEQMAEDVTFTPVQSGITRWHPTASYGMQGVGETSSPNTFLAPETTFSVKLDLHHYKVGDVIAIYSLARTDQGWVFAGDGSSTIGSIPAQSNIVNARTNAMWSHVHANSMDGGSMIKGRLDWFSVPVTIEIGPQPGFFEGNEPVEKSVRPSDEGYEPLAESGNAIVYSVFMAVVVLAITLCCVFCREERDGTDIFSVWSEHRRITRQKISMDDFFSNEALEMTVTNSNLN